MLINLRNALMGGKRLPYDAEVEFLESTGTQYIDTGVVPTNTKTEITFSTPTPPTSGYMCGSFNANNRYYPVAYMAKRILIINAVNTTIASFTNDGGIHTIVYNAAGGACYFDGVAAGTLSTTTLTASNPIYLFGTSTATGVSGCVSGRVYSLKIYDENGTLVRDFIPVRKGTVGYLYDRVSGKLFGNEGTGDFVLGQDVVPVEYIESHGAEWINTEFGFDSSTDRVELSLSIPYQTTTSNSWIWGRYFTNNTIGMSFRNDSVATAVRFYFKTISPAITLDFSSFSSGKRDVRFDSSGILVDGERQYSYSGSQFSSDSELYLFAVNNNGTVLIGPNMTVYSYSHYRNNVLVRKLKPVRVGTEGAMMDVLTRRIYRNAGTGAFTYGNDLKYPIPSE